MSDRIAIADKSQDRKYFTITPNLVWALCRDTYDFTLWCTVKMIAGEEGECFLSTEDLATLSMMSAGKVSQCRKYLIDEGLLGGEIRRDPGYPQPVWHLHIPDLWERNIRWRQQKGDSLRDRITFKAQQKSLHQVKPSPGEGGPSPGEGGPSPGETKKNQKNIQKEEPENSLFEKGDDYLAVAAKCATAQETNGNFADPRSNAAAEAALVAMYEAVDSEPPQKGGAAWDQEIGLVGEVLQSRKVTDPDIAKKAGQLFGQANRETPQFVNPRQTTFPSAFGLFVGRAKKQAGGAKQRRARDIEIAEASQAAFEERMAAKSQVAEDDKWGVAIKGELALQMTNATFETYVRPTTIVLDDGVLRVTASSAFDADWLEDRLLTTIRRTAIGVVGHEIEVEIGT